ncbi:MAG: tyrosine-type recombinase/integrase [Planctomycetota bacterium]
MPVTHTKRGTYEISQEKKKTPGLPVMTRYLVRRLKCRANQRKTTASILRILPTFLVKLDEKYCPINAITTKFARMIKRAKLDVPKGTGFYTLRRTAATMAARSGDPFAVQGLLGHANLIMATRYVQDVSKQTDDVIGKSRMYLTQCI